MQSTAVQSQPILLNKNENPFPPLPPVVRTIRAIAGGLNRYGEFKAQLPREIAGILGSPEESVIVGNGSTDLLFTIARALLRPGDTAAVPGLSFVVYDFAVQQAGAQLLKVPAKGLAHDLSRLAQAAHQGARLVVICTPNNPTATVIPPPELHAFLVGIPETTVILLDEAYGEFLRPSERLDTIRLAVERPNLITLRTLSKLHGLAGLRVGFAVGSPELMPQIARLQPTFHISILAQIAGAESLRHPRLLEQRRRFFERERARIVAALEQLGVPYAPPSASFYLVDFGLPPQQVLTEIERRGVQITDPGIGNYVRVSIGSREDNDAFLSAAADLLGRPAPVISLAREEVMA